jgi:hypothetical protein
MKDEILIVTDAVSRCRGAMSMCGIDFRAVMGFAIGFSRFPMHEGVFWARRLREKRPVFHAPENTYPIPPSSSLSVVHE